MPGECCCQRAHNGAEATCTGEATEDYFLKVLKGVQKRRLRRFLRVLKWCYKGFLKLPEGFFHSGL